VQSKSSNKKLNGAAAKIGAIDVDFFGGCVVSLNSHTVAHFLAQSHSTCFAHLQKESMHIIYSIPFFSSSSSSILFSDSGNLYGSFIHSSSVLSDGLLSLLSGSWA